MDTIKSKKKKYGLATLCERIRGFSLLLELHS